jgi:glyoxylate reductase
MARIVCTSYLFPDQTDRLKDAGHEVWIHEGDGPIPRERLIAELADAEALICLLTDRIDRELLGAAQRLRVVANVAVGYENVDIDTASELGIVVTNTPDVLTEATADLTFALLLAAARRIAEADAAVRGGEFPAWGLDQPLTGTDVHGKTLGIVGMGRIGTAVARRGHSGFGMRILYHSRTRNASAEAEFDAEKVAFGRLLEESDFVSVHVPLTDETHHLIDRDAFARMKPSAILVNVARGSVVDEEVLVRALEAGEIAGAGIDVYEHEPDVHPGLLRLRERVVLTPHLGSATGEARRSMARLAVDNVLAVLSGRPTLTPVN